MALQVVDRTMQAFGAEGLSQDQELAYMFANLRTLRIADVSCSEFSQPRSCLHLAML
jgi:acyl-CoA dehydrogenase